MFRTSTLNKNKNFPAPKLHSSIIGESLVHSFVFKLSIIFFLCLSSNAYSKTLRILTWPDYMDPSIVTKFEEETGATIEFTYFDGAEERDNIVSDRNQNHDITLISDYDIKEYVNNKSLHLLKKKSMPNLKNIASRWRYAVQFSGSYGVPYFWGTLGIAYRKDLYPKGFPSWKNFFEPEDILKNKIAILDDSREVFGMAVKALGFSANTNNSTAIEKASDMLKMNRQFVHQYKLISLNEDSKLLKGEVWAAMIYSGDALVLMDYNDDINYVIPDEGGNLWVDFLVILKKSKNKILAEQFLDFINTPQIAAENALFVNYATPNMAAHEFVTKEYLSTSIIFPNKDVLSRSEIFKELNPSTIYSISSTFENVISE